MNEEAKAARREYYRAYYRTHKQELQNTRNAIGRNMSKAQSRRKQPKMETERIAHIAEQASKKSRIAYCLLRK